MTLSASSAASALDDHFSEARLEHAGEQILGGKRRDEIFHVCFPASFPAVFAGLQISLSSAWTCVLAAELMNSRDGMGFLIKRGMDTHQPTLVLGGMVLIAAAAYGTSLLVTLFEGKLCPWKRTIENL